MCYVSTSAIKNAPTKSNLREEEFILAYSLRERESTVAGRTEDQAGKAEQQKLAVSRPSSGQDGESKHRVGQAIKPQTTPSDVPHPLKVTSP